MRHSILAFIFPVVFLFLAGCGSSPTSRWIAARETLTAAQDSVVFMHESEVITDETLVQAHGWAISARVALEVARRNLPEGGPDFESWLEVVAAGIERMRQTALAPIKESDR
jgi:flavin-binding protein dodecin